MTEPHQPIYLSFEAHQPERNHHRAYEVEVGQDLLFEWVVTVRYGRAARPGHQLTYAVADLNAARAFVRGRLRRRLSAPKRLGCGFRFTRAVFAEGVELVHLMKVGLLCCVMNNSSTSLLSTKRLTFAC